MTFFLLNFPFSCNQRKHSQALALASVPAKDQQSSDCIATVGRLPGLPWRSAAQVTRTREGSLLVRCRTSARAWESAVLRTLQRAASCWPSAALSGHSGELQAATKVCNLATVGAVNTNICWLFLIPRVLLNSDEIFSLFFSFFIHQCFYKRSTFLWGRKLTPALLIIYLAIAVAADLLMDNKLASSSEF